MKITVVLEHGEENWGAYAPDLEDCVVAVGDTREETITRFRDALRGLIRYKQEKGLLSRMSRNWKSVRWSRLNILTEKRPGAFAPGLCVDSLAACNV